VATTSFSMGRVIPRAAKRAAIMQKIAAMMPSRTSWRVVAAISPSTSARDITSRTVPHLTGPPST
jgi:hypothetical protein